MNLESIGVWIWDKERTYRFTFRYAAGIPRMAIKSIILDDLRQSAKYGSCVWYGVLPVSVRDVTAIYFEE